MIEEQAQHPSNNQENNSKLKYYRESESQRRFLRCNSFKLRFPTIIGSVVDSNLFAAAKGLIGMTMVPQLGIPRDQEEADLELPMEKPTFQTSENEIKYTWIGHSTAVISFGKDANFIIDPVFSDRCSPSQLFGPQRFRPPACLVSQLPAIHAVLVSHDHYDHMDQKDLRQLYERNPQAYFIAGLNSRDVFAEKCNMKQMDWTQKQMLMINGKKFEVTFVPVCHWSRRGATDYCKRLWGGFVIETQTGQKVFYSGDTAYCEIFQELGKIFGGFDLAILPIGAYIPRDFLKNQHVNPQEAVIIHQEIRAKKSVGVHWGTFPLGRQHFTAARRDLEEAKKKYNLHAEEFITVNHGGNFTIKYS